MATDYTSLGLEALALTMIFLPEPATTAVGVALLTYARKRRINNIRKAGANRTATGLESSYYYKVHKSTDDLISYHLAPINQGQLAKTLPRGISMSSQPGWEAYRSKPLQYRAKRIPPSVQIGQLPKTLHKAGPLIQNPQEWRAYRSKAIQQAVKKTTLTPAGQLPTLQYKSAGLIKKREEWQTYRSSSSILVTGKRPTQQFSGLQQGLLHKP
jgi:hypothetical protein